MFAMVGTTSLALAQGSAPALPDPVLPDKVTRISEHVYAIIGFPNIGIVVGNRGTLVVDSGLGERNGALIVRHVEQLAKGPELYLTSTHYHAEHIAGEGAFPTHTVIIRNAVQQEEVDRLGSTGIELFSRRFKEQLIGVKPLRKADRVYEREMTLDLGGVTAKLFWLGPAHTRGDQLVWIAEDRTLLTGDLVHDKRVPFMLNEDGILKGWLGILDQLETMKPVHILPNHGLFGDGSLIGKERRFILDMQARALKLKRKGVSVEDAAKQLTADFTAKNPEWEMPGGVASVVRRAYAENP